MIVYLIKNKVNGKSYVGVTVSTLEHRLQVHLSHVKRGSGFAIHNAIRKYGFQSFKVSVLDAALSQKVLWEKERYWINKLKTKAPGGYNLTGGGEGVGKLPDTVRREWSKKAKARGVTKQFLKAGKLWQFGVVPAWNKGKKLSSAHKEALSKAHQGNKHSKETRAKMSAARKGHPIPNWHGTERDSLGRFVPLTRSIQ